jgi:hypothetical protein
MIDIVYIAVIVLFSFLTWGLLKLCTLPEDRKRGTRS